MQLTKRNNASQRSPLNINSNMNMTKIELNPLKGIHIAQVGTIEFGMTANEVKEILGQPEQEDDSQLYYCSEELRLDFNSQKCLEFIEIISGPYPKAIEPILYDVNPFVLLANELVDLLTQKNGYDIDYSEVLYVMLSEVFLLAYSESFQKKQRNKA